MKKVLIIGCGLLGSSLVRRISKKKLAKKIFIYEKSKSNILKIRRLKLPGIIVKSLEDGVVNSDLVIFCTPMSEYKKLIIKINRFISSKTIITDIGSSKIESSKVIKKFLKRGIHWIQSHPITGSEVSGPEHGKENMFKDKWCILIKDKKTNSRNLKFLNSFWKKVGSKTVMMNVEKHDKIFSITSHLPHLVAYNLVKSAQDFEKKQKYDLIKKILSCFSTFIITVFDPTFFQKEFKNFKCFKLVLLSLINIHHLSLNIFSLPCSGPLTSDPVIG